MDDLQQRATILLVEDNLGDIKLTQKALERARLANDLWVVRDGEMALAFLRNEPPYEDAPRPDLLLLDLNLPKCDGWEVLEVLKSTPELKRIPVIVLTSSDAEQDILRSYDLYANCFITKPVDLTQFLEVINTIEGFWLQIVKLPS